MTRAAWSPVLLTVVILVTLSQVGTWVLPPGDLAPPPNSATLQGPAPAEHGGHVARSRLHQWREGITARLAATGPEEWRWAVVGLLGVASFGVLLRGIGVATRNRKDRRPTPATHLGRWTRRTGLARDAARFLMIRNQRQDLPHRGSAAITPERPRRG